MDLLHKNSTQQLNKSPVRLRLLQILCLVIFLSLTSTPVWSCQGQDRAEALQLLYDTLINAYMWGLTGDSEKYVPAIEDAMDRINALSPSCKALVNQISDQIGDAYSPNAVTCRGGVCCDGTGCY